MAASAGQDGSSASGGAAGQSGLSGEGGVGVAGSGDTRVINDGTISGGWSADGLTQANAVEFQNGGNVLEIRSNSVIEGKAIATRAVGEMDDILELGGDADQTFDVARIGTQYVGFSQFAKTGASTWTLSGTTSELTPWTLQAGVLSVSEDGSLGDISGGLTFEGGALRITGTTYATTGRTITLGSGGGILDIADTGHTFTLSQGLTGPGGLTKTGAGSLVLNGANTYSGITDVAQGTLILGETAANNGAFVSGDAVIRSGATLAGHGSVGGDLTNSGSLSPGNPAGDHAVFTIHGDYTQTAGGTLRMDVDPQNATGDLLAVGGIARLDGGLIINPANQTAWHTKQIIVDAAGGVSGIFATVEDNSATLDTVARYDANTVYIDVYRNNVVFETEVPGLTENQESTAGALDQLPTGDPIRQAVLEAGEENAPSSLDALSGEIHADAGSALLASERVTRLVMSGNIRNRINGDSSRNGPAPVPEMRPPPADSKSGMPYEEPATEPMADAPARRYHLWGELVADDLTLDGDGNAATTEQSLAGIYAGVNIPLANGWETGIAYGHTEADLDVRDRNSSAEIGNNVLAGTIGRSWQHGDNAINFFLGGSYTRSDVSTKRHVSVGPLNETLVADYDADSAQLFTEVGYEMKAGRRGVLEPFLGLGYAAVRGDGYREKGGIAALEGDGIEADEFNTTLGMRFRQGFDVGRLPAWVRAGAGWQHSFGDGQGTTDHSFSVGPDFHIKGSPLDKDSAVIDLGAGVRLTDSLGIGATYDGRFSENNSENTYRLNLDWKF